MRTNRVRTMGDIPQTTYEPPEDPARAKRDTPSLERPGPDRDEIQEALTRSETTFRKLTEKSIVGVYLVQDWLFRYVNPKMAEMFGYELRELIDVRGPEQVVFEDDWPLVKENLRQRLIGEVESMNYGFRGVKSSGEIIHIEVYGSQTDYQGRPAVIGTILDVTERVQADRKLQAQLHRFQVLYHIAVAMAAEHTLEENLALIVDKCRQLLNADTAFIAVSDKGHEMTHVYAQSGCRRAMTRKARTEFLTSAQLHLAIDEAGDDAEVLFKRLKVLAKRFFYGEGLQAGIAVPVRMRKAAIGALCVASRSKRLFTESEKDSVALIGNIAALEIAHKRAEERLSHSESELRLLSAQLLRAQENERRRVAQELHDGIGQSLSAIKFRIESFSRQAAAAPGHVDGTSLDVLVSMIQSTVEEVQRIAMDLRPSILDDLGLVATLRWFLREFQATYSGIAVRSGIALDEDEIPESLKIVVFRIAQEALNNVARHSRAGQVRFGLKKRKNQIELTIEDDGIGIDSGSAESSSSSGKGFGIASMKERAELSDGTFVLQTGPNRGTAIRATWPFGSRAIGK